MDNRLTLLTLTLLLINSSTGIELFRRVRYTLAFRPRTVRVLRIVLLFDIIGNILAGCIVAITAKHPLPHYALASLVVFQLACLCFAVILPVMLAIERKRLTKRVRNAINS